MLHIRAERPLVASAAPLTFAMLTGSKSAGSAALGIFVVFALACGALISSHAMFITVHSSRTSSTAGDRPVSASIAGIVSRELRGTRISQLQAADNALKCEEALPAHTHALETSFIAGSLIGERFALELVQRDDSHRVAPGRGERLCVGKECVGQRWFMINQLRPSSDAILSYILRSEWSVMEWLATLLLSDECSGIVGDGVHAPTCRLDAPAATPLFFDVGSNAGFYSLMAAACGAEVIAIDPQPHCSQYVRAGALLSGFASRVHVINAFAAAEDLSAAAVVKVRSGCWGTFPSKDSQEDDTRKEYDVLLGGNESTTVPAVSLPALIRSSIAARLPRGGAGYVLAMKIDAEGSEVGIIQALASAGILQERLVRNFMIEFNKDAIERNAAGSACSRDVVACYASLVDTFIAAGYVALASVHGPWGGQAPIVNSTEFAERGWGVSDMWCVSDITCRARNDGMPMPAS